jgi:hypothetical protein
MKYHEKREYHGMSNSPEYEVWTAIKQRCSNKNEVYYESYGGRGTTFCSEWEYFSNFTKDVGHRPSSSYQIDRIDNNKGYSKENCRWVLPNVNGANKRRKFGLGTYKKGNRHIAQICIYGETYYLGSFKVKESAQNAYMNVFKEWYGFEPNKEKENGI